jgi:hypothetical protein
MKPEKRNLIQTLMDEDEVVLRETTLLEGGRILRRRRWRRMAGRSFAGIAILTLAVLSIQKVTQPRRQVLTTIALPQKQTAALTDAELLAMFPKTPIGLMTLENGKKRLIFPRHSDEERFIARY